MDENRDMTYIGLARCGCLMWVAIDISINYPSFPAKEIAKQTAYSVKHGESVEHVTTQYVRDMPWKCKEHKE